MSEVAQDRRTYLVTGATSGIGLAITSQLAAAGHRVIIGARSEQRGDAAALRVRECTSEARLDVVTGDLANMSDVSKLALQVQQLTPQVDGLILNAAVSRSRPEITAEGYEINFATNYLAGFWLTHLLMATLMAAHQPRVIALASSQHTHVTELDVSTLGRGEGVEPRHRYVTTKLLDILFVTDLARRTKETGLTALAADPGFVRTDLGRDLTGWMALLLKLTRPIQNSPDTAARTPVHLATSPDVGALSGGYFSKSKPARCSPLARDPELAHRLWEHTSRLLAIPS